MRRQYFLLFILFASCQSNTTNKPAPVDSTVHTKDSMQSGTRSTLEEEISDSIYKVGDYLFEGDKELIFDYFRTGHPPHQLKSNGDTLYSDSSYTIFADHRKVEGIVYKKYVPKYRFVDYKVEKSYTGSLAKPDFSTDPPAREYKTVIGERCSDSAVNFAGHYTIAEWGCGTQCGVMAVIDRTNGRVFYSNNYIPFDTADGHWGIDYRKDSKLVIVNSYLLKDHHGYMMQENWRKLSFYKWNGEGFIKVD